MPYNVPYSLHLLLLVLLSAPYEQMPSLGLAPLNVHELVEFKHPPLAAAPTFASLVEYRRSRMMHAALALSVAALECLSTAPPFACHALLDLQTRIVVL
jgi:hypothetical protein